MTVVCSDESRNGKTLMARVIADHLLLTGRDPHVFDCDQPRGDIVRFFPSRSSLIDLERTSGQIRLFDTALADPTRDYVVDLPAHGLDPFFTVIDDLDFINAAHDAGLELFIVFMLDKTSVVADDRARPAWRVLDRDVLPCAQCLYRQWHHNPSGT